MRLTFEMVRSNIITLECFEGLQNLTDKVSRGILGGHRQACPRLESAHLTIAQILAYQIIQHRCLEFSDSTVAYKLESIRIVNENHS